MSSIDAHVGAQLRLRRKQLRISLIRLARAVGIEVNQLAAIEEGHVRLEPKAMAEVAEVLRVDVSYFFEGFVGVAESGCWSSDKRNA